MTTLAWDGSTLAADTQMTSCGMRDVTQKIFEMPNGFAAVCGSLESALPAIEWLRNGGHGEKPDLDGSSIMYVSLKGQVIEYCGKMVGVAAKGKRANGSGRDYALGAMEMGADAVKAVKIASKFDIYTGGPVHSVMIVKPKTGKR